MFSFVKGKVEGQKLDTLVGKLRQAQDENELQELRDKYGMSGLAALEEMGRDELQANYLLDMWARENGVRWDK